MEHDGKAEQFYRSLAGQVVRVGMEASGHSRWFERLLAELGHELWIGDPAKIRAAATRKQKTDRRDAEHILGLLLAGQFEKLRIWVPTAEQRDVRQLVTHRHRLVQMRTRVKNQLRAVALNEGLGRKPGLWSQKGQEQFKTLELPAWTAQRRQDNLELLAELEKRTAPLDQAVEREASKRPEVDALADPPRSRSDHGVGVRADHRRPGALPLRQAGGQLSGPDSGRRQFGRAATAGAHQQARQCAVTGSAGGGGAL